MHVGSISAELFLWIVAVTVIFCVVSGVSGPKKAVLCSSCKNFIISCNSEPTLSSIICQNFANIQKETPIQ